MDFYGVAMTKFTGRCESRWALRCRKSGSSDFNGGFTSEGHHREVDEGASRLSCET